MRSVVLRLKNEVKGKCAMWSGNRCVFVRKCLVMAGQACGYFDTYVMPCLIPDVREKYLAATQPKRLKQGVL